MKYVSALLITLIIASCQDSRKGVEFNSKNDLSAKVKLLKPTNILSKKDNATKVSLDKDLNIIEEAILTTAKLVYTKAFDHTIFNDLLQKHVSVRGNVNYAGFQKDKHKLNTYINQLSENTPTEEWTKPEKLAYWINAYNALTIDLILKHPTVKSIKDIKNSWDQRLWTLGDRQFNLSDIEHEILRKMGEPRIHFAIVCASVSCPKLQNEAFTAAHLERQLTKATKEFLADTSKNELSKDEIKLSKIFKWFKNDFEQNGSLIDFLNRYASVKISDNAKKSYTDYNWNLND